MLRNSFFKSLTSSRSLAASSKLRVSAAARICSDNSSIRVCRSPAGVPAATFTLLRGATSAANATKSLDRKTVAEAIRGKTVNGTILGDVAFEPNGQARHKHTIFKVTDGKTAKLEVLK